MISDGRLLVLGAVGALAVAGAAHTRSASLNKGGSLNDEAKRRARAQAILPHCLGERDDYYHVTSIGAMPLIARQGLKPRTAGVVTQGFLHLAAWSQGKLFLAAGEGAGVTWWKIVQQAGRDNPVLLRVRRDSVRNPQIDSKGFGDVECSVFVTHVIPATALRFWNPDADHGLGGWSSLSAWRAPKLNEEGFLTRAESFCPNWEPEPEAEDEE